MSKTVSASLAKTHQVCANVGGYAVDASAFIVSEVEPLEKAMKVVAKTIDLSELLGKGTVPGPVVSAHLKESIMLVETLSFFRLLQLTFRPKNGKYFLTDPANSWQRRAARVSILSHSTLKLFYAAQKWKFTELAFEAKHSVGKLHTFRLVTDGLYVFYNIFSAWDNIRTIVNCTKAKSLVNKKIAKWQSHSQTVDLVRQGDQKTIAKLSQKYSANIDNTKKMATLNAEKLHQLDTDPKLLKLSEKKRGALRQQYQSTAEKIAAKMSKLPLWEERLKKIETKDFTGLATDLASKNVDKKLEKWRFDKFTVVLNLKKAVLGFLSAAAKATVVALALTWMAIDFATLPLTAFLISLSAFADSVGLTRMLIDKFPPKYKPVIAQPQPA